MHLLELNYRVDLWVWWIGVRGGDVSLYILVLFYMYDLLHEFHTLKASINGIFDTL